MGPELFVAVTGQPIMLNGPNWLQFTVHDSMNQLETVTNKTG